MYSNVHTIDKDKIITYLERLNQSVNSLFELFNNLLIWSKIQTGTLEFKNEKADLRNVIIKAFKSYADYSSRKKIIFKNQISVDTIVIMDNNILTLILNNLIFNALKLSMNGSIVKIYSKDTENDTIKVFVENTGFSMKKEELDKIFSDHSLKSISNTQNEWSSAIGILLCKELIEKNQGSFEVISQADGNIVSFTLKKG